jgi:uncharacterized protein (DUF4415 family)
LDVHIGTSRRHLSAHLKKQRVTSPLDLDVMTYFEKDGKGLLSHMNADLRELAGLAPKKGK